MFDSRNRKRCFISIKCRISTIVIIGIFLLFSSQVFASQSKSKNELTKKDMVGSWNISLKAPNAGSWGDQNWAGIITIQLKAEKLQGILEWECKDVAWIIKEKLDITLNGNQIKMTGTEVIQIKKPNSKANYNVDNFEAIWNSTNKEFTSISFKDSGGRSASFKIWR